MKLLDSGAMNRVPHILFIQTDAQHHRWLGFANEHGPRTPNLDRLARERAVVFDQAFSCSGVCVPSRASLITGRYPIAHGVTRNDMLRRPETEPALGRLLRDAGYVTGYFGKTHFAGNDLDMPSEGWQVPFTKAEYAAHLAKHDINIKYPEKSLANRRPTRYWNFGTSRIPNEHYFENVIADQAVAFIEQHRDRPFMCYVSNVAPHGPFSPPEPYASMYDPAQMKLAPRTEGELDGMPPQTQRWIRQNARYLDDAALRHWLSIAYGLVTMVDDNVGKLMNCLDRCGLWDNTLVIFTSDHGDFATRYGILGKSWCMTDDLLRLPLLVHHPESRYPASGDGAVPRRCDELVQSLDLTATMLEWADIEVPTRMHGHSIMPLLSDSPQPIREHVFAYDQHQYSQDLLYSSMVRSPDWKYVRSTDCTAQLYDLRCDPLETRNVVNDPANARVVDELREALTEWHLRCSGGFFDEKEAVFWEDDTAFYDETRFTGQRLQEHSWQRTG